jgi:tetratricopeptide (TPR) repeat protein
MEAAFGVLAAQEPDEDLATLAAQLGRMYSLKGEFELAAERIEVALHIAESLWLPEVLSQALNTKGIIAAFRGHSEEGLALLTHALKVALENDLPTAALRAYVNLSDSLGRRDRYDDALEQARLGLALARKVGNRVYEWRLIGEATSALSLTGRWTETLGQVAELPQQELAAAFGLLPSLPELYVNHGSLTEARDLLALLVRYETSLDFQERAEYAATKAIVLHAEGSHANAVAAGEEAFQAREELGAGNQAVKAGFVWAVEAALALGNLTKAGELLAVIEQLPPGQRPPFLQAQAARLRACLAAAHGDREGVQAGFKAAAGMLRELGIPFWLAVTLLEHAEWLVKEGDAQQAGPLLIEARAIFERLGAQPWLERLALHPTAPQILIDMDSV